MGRGKHEKTKIKEDIKYAAKATVAAEIAAEEAKRKQWAKNIPMVLQEKLMGFIDRIDPLELTAIIALTPFVKSVVVGIGGAVQGSREWYYSMWKDIDPFLIYLRNEYGEEGSDPTQNPLFQSAIHEWLISFGLTYMLVHNFGDIISAGGSIAGWLGGLLAAV